MVGKLMSTQSKLKDSERLRLATNLRPVKRNVTRWFGVTNMCDRFERLLVNIDNANNEIAELIPSAAQKNIMSLVELRSLSNFLPSRF